MIDSAHGCGRRPGGFGFAGLALGLVACGGGGSSGSELGAAAGASSCTALKTGDPVTIDADVHVLASDMVRPGSAGPLSRALLPSGGEVYWLDEGSVFVERQDQRVVELMHFEPSPPRPESPLGLAANSEHLYVGYAYGTRDDVGELEYVSPGHLFAISKQDGQVTSLLDGEERWLAPITANDERLIVFAMSSKDMGFYQVPLDHPRLEALPLGTASYASDGSAEWDRDRLYALVDLALGGRLVGDQVYWVSSWAEPYGLLRSGFDDAEPKRVGPPLPLDLSWIGPGYFMSLEGVIDSGHHYLGQDFVQIDDSGCRSLPGPRGERVGSVALDAQHAYWSGYRASGSDATFSQTLHRVDLETGAEAGLNAPGVPPDYDLSFVAQDDTRLFLWSNGTLLSLRKP